MKGKDKNLVELLFLNEEWHKYDKNIYVAESRIPKTKGKCADVIVDNEFVEFKDITGNRNSIGDEYKRALKQADNVFLKTQGVSLNAIKAKLVGTTKVILQNNGKISKEGKIYLWCKEKLEILKISELMEKAEK